VVYAAARRGRGLCNSLGHLCCALVSRHRSGCLTPPPWQGTWLPERHRSVPLPQRHCQMLWTPQPPPMPPPLAPPTLLSLPLFPSRLPGSPPPSLSPSPLPGWDLWLTAAPCKALPSRRIWRTVLVESLLTKTRLLTKSQETYVVLHGKNGLVPGAHIDLYPTCNLQRPGTRACICQS